MPWEQFFSTRYLRFIKMADHDANHRCFVEKNVPIALILPNRWQDGAESLGMERTIFLWLFDYQNKLNGNPGLHLFIFVLFHTSTEFVQKTVDFRWNRRQASWPLDHHHGPRLTKVEVQNYTWNMFLQLWAIQGIFTHIFAVFSNYCTNFLSWAYFLFCLLSSLYPFDIKVFL